MRTTQLAKTTRAYIYEDLVIWDECTRQTKTDHTE